MNLQSQSESNFINCGSIRKNIWSIWKIEVHFISLPISHCHPQCKYNLFMSIYFSGYGHTAHICEVSYVSKTDWNCKANILWFLGYGIFQCVFYSHTPYILYKESNSLYLGRIRVFEQVDKLFFHGILL